MGAAPWELRVRVRRAAFARRGLAFGAAGPAALLLLLLPPPLRAQDASPESIRGEIRAGRLEPAERLSRELVAANERLYGGESKPVAEALDLLAESLRRGGKYPQSLAACQRALRIKEALLPPLDPSLAVSLENLGTIHVAMGDRVAARGPLERALKIRQHVHGPVHGDVARSLLYLANLADAESRDAEALALVEQAIAIQDSIVSPEDPMRAVALNMLATFRLKLGDYTGAGTAYEQVLSLQTRTLGAEHAATASTLHNLGVLCLEMGDDREGRRYLERALATMRRGLGAGHPLIARTLTALGSALERLGDLPGALSRYGAALKIQRESFGPNSAEFAWTLMKRGQLELRMGHAARATTTLRRALRMQAETLRPGDQDMAWTLSALGSAEAMRGMADSSLAHSRRAVEIQEKALGPSHPDLAPTMARLSRVHALLGDTTSAVDAALRSALIRAEHLRLTAAGLAERQALSYATEGPTGLDEALSLIGHQGSRAYPAAVRRVWDAAIQTRTLVLDEMASRHRVALADTADSATNEARVQLREARQRIANLLVRGPGSDPPDRYEALLRRGRLEMERAERVLGDRSATFRAQGTIARRGLSEVLTALPPPWGLVAYAVSETDRSRRYVAFVFGADREPQAVDLGDARLIDRLVTRWAESVLQATDEVGPAARRGEAASRAAGETLRKAAWDPLREAIGGAKSLFIVPDGALHAMNFGALPAWGGGYLVEEDLILHYVASEKDLVPQAVPRLHGEGLLALGGVDFGSGSAPDVPSPPRNGAGGANGSDPGTSAAIPWNCSGFRGARFASLPQSRLEVEEIAELWGDARGVTIVTGGDATEASFKRLAPGKRVLHLATHGFFLDPDRCLPAGGETRGIGGIESRVPPKRPAAFQQQNPLLLSGLALAAANSRSEASVGEEDGILTAEEVASLDLRGVDWAVLSACDTGVAGVARGEGILGLRRAFQTAGVATLVISLWPVQDQATREWMRALYRSRFHEGADTARAIRAATLQALQSRRAQGRSTSPFFWAAFLAAGDWN